MDGALPDGSLANVWKLDYFYQGGVPFQAGCEGISQMMSPQHVKLGKSSDSTKTLISGMSVDGSANMTPSTAPLELILILK